MHVHGTSLWVALRITLLIINCGVVRRHRGLRIRRLKEVTTVSQSGTLVICLCTDIL